MKITRRDVPTSHIKVIKRYFPSPSRSQSCEYILSRAFPPRTAARAALVCTSVFRIHAYTYVPHTHECRARSITLSLLNNNTMRDRPRSRVHMHTFYLHPTPFPSAFCSSFFLFARLPSYRTLISFSVFRSPGQLTCYNVATRRV